MCATSPQHLSRFAGEVVVGRERAERFSGSCQSSSARVTEAFGPEFEALFKNNTVQGLDVRHFERLLEELGVRWPHPVENNTARGGQEKPTATPSGRYQWSLRHTPDATGPAAPTSWETSLQSGNSSNCSNSAMIARADCALGDGRSVACWIRCLNRSKAARASVSVVLSWNAFRNCRQ